MPYKDMKKGKAYKAAYYQTHKDKAKVRRLSVYGLTKEAFDDLLAGQGGVCAICGTDNWGGRFGSPMVDHDHGDPANVRGILCCWCNTAIGYLRDNPGLARAAADYLERK